MPYIIYFPNTGTARVFESYNLAQANYPKQPILSGPNMVPPEKALEWYEALFENLDSAGTHFTYGTERVTSIKSSTTYPKPRYAEGLDTKALQETFWRLAVDCGDRVNRHLRNNETKGKRASGFRVDLVAANATLASQTPMPEQARSIIQFLTEQEYDFYTREEMIRTCHSLAFIKHVKTKQDPWRIFRYYGPLLTKLGVLK